MELVVEVAECIACHWLVGYGANMEFGEVKK